MGMPVTHDDLAYIEHRVYHDYVSSIDYNMADPNIQENSNEAGSEPYE